MGQIILPFHDIINQKSITVVFMDLKKITLERYSVEYMSDVIEWGHGGIESIIIQECLL